MVIVDAFYRRWRAGGGMDRTYLAAGGFADTRINEACWRSRGLALGLAFSIPDRW
jgi:hypothetical protein